jgi:EAL domain
LLALTALGVHLAIDDFGTGYSSFAQLKTLPVETLKIDRGFVTKLADNHDDQAIVRSIIQLATSFGLQTMAEGVETPEAAAALIELGCHQAQGYLIGRPGPPGEMAGRRRRLGPDPGRPVQDPTDLLLYADAGTIPAAASGRHSHRSSWLALAAKTASRAARGSHPYRPEPQLWFASSTKNRPSVRRATSRTAAGGRSASARSARTSSA